MDTRSKIKPLEDLASVLARSKWTAVVGWFDPLTAAQAKRLADAAKGDRKVLAVVLPTQDGLLSAEARAALVAAVRGVSAVVIADEQQWRSTLPQNADIAIIDDLDADKKRSQEFVEFVLRRQEASRCPSS